MMVLMSFYRLLCTIVHISKAVRRILEGWPKAGRRKNEGQKMRRTGGLWWRDTKTLSPAPSRYLGRGSSYKKGTDVPGGREEIEDSLNPPA